MANRRKKVVPITPEDIGARMERLLRGGKGPELMTRDERVALGKRDPDWFNAYYLGDYFSDKPAAFHAEMNSMVECYDRVAIAAPREHAKSTVVSFALPVRRICYRLSRFIVLIRESDEIAHQAVDDIRMELESNERIREDFGDLVGERKWAEGEFITANGCKMLGRGRGSSLRGARFKQFRPDLVIADDIEDDELVQSRTRREKLHRWWQRVVSNIVGPGGKLFIVGTILHHDSLLAKLLKLTEIYVAKVWRAIAENGKLLWAARWPLSRLEAKKKEIGTRAFEGEFQNNAANEEDQIFEPGWWKRFSDRDIEGLKFTLTAACDPSTGKSRKSDFTANVVVGEANGNFYFLYAMIRRQKLPVQIETIFAIYRNWPGITRYGIETIAYQEVLKQGVLDKSKRDRTQIPVVEIPTHSGRKEMRISRLAPLAEQGRMYFPSATSHYWSADMALLMDQFEQIGVSEEVHDDGPDAAEMAIGLLRGLKRRSWRAGYAERAA